jgi:hypothetical protein
MTWNVWTPGLMTCRANLRAMMLPPSLMGPGRLPYAPERLYALRLHQIQSLTIFAGLSISCR